MENDKRYGRIFGKGTLVGDNADELGFFTQTNYEKALALGWSHGCPIPKQLADPKNREFGPEKILKRYAEVNFWFGYITQTATRLNPLLGFQLKTPTARRSGEPVGKFEAESVPIEKHKRFISPMSGIYGYSTPRVFIEILGKEKSPQRTKFALDLLDYVAKTSKSRAELLVRLAGSAVSIGTDPKIILSHILPKGVLEEENCFKDFKEIKRETWNHSPLLRNTYTNMGDKEKNALGIADI